MGIFGIYGKFDDKELHNEKRNEELYKAAEAGKKSRWKYHQSSTQ